MLIITSTDFNFFPLGIFGSLDILTLLVSTSISFEDLTQKNDDALSN